MKSEIAITNTHANTQQWKYSESDSSSDIFLKQQAAQKKHVKLTKSKPIHIDYTVFALGFSAGANKTANATTHNNLICRDKTHPQESQGNSTEAICNSDPTHLGENILDSQIIIDY